MCTLMSSRGCTASTVRSRGQGILTGERGSHSRHMENECFLFGRRARMINDQPTLGSSFQEGGVHCQTVSRNMRGCNTGVVSQLEIQPSRDSHLRCSGLRVIPFCCVALTGDRNRTKVTSPTRLPNTVASTFQTHTLHYVLGLQTSLK